MTAADPRPLAPLTGRRGAEAPAPDVLRFVDLDAQRRRLGSRIDDAVRRVLDHQRFIDGPEVADLEGRLAAAAGVAHAVTCSSGTDALVLSLLALGVRPGDHVVVPTFTFAATAEAVAFLGAVPVFADVDEATFCLAPDSLERALERGRAAGHPPVGVIPVDLFGHPAPHDEIEARAGAHDAWVLVDAAQSFGSAAQGRPTGSRGRATTTSFFPAKPLGCYGDGGAVLTDDSDLAAVLRSLRNHGAGADRYENVRIGMTGRLDTLQAAVLIEKLAIFDDELAARRRVADRYGALLAADRLGLGLPAVADGATSAWAQYTCRLAGRDDLVDRLGAAGVPTAVYYPVPLHGQPAYRGFPVVDGGTPVAESLCGTVVSLPMHPYLTDGQLERIAAAVTEALEGTT